MKMILRILKKLILTIMISIFFSSILQTSNEVKANAEDIKKIMNMEAFIMKRM